MRARRCVVTVRGEIDSLSRMLVDLVHPLQGTASTHSLSRGNCLPLVARPWGMTHWSPQTSESNWLFHPDEPKLQGVRSGEAYTHVPTRRSARVAATASVGPGAGCHC